MSFEQKIDKIVTNDTTCLWQTQDAGLYLPRTAERCKCAGKYSYMATLVPIPNLPHLPYWLNSHLPRLLPPSSIPSAKCPLAVIISTRYQALCSICVFLQARCGLLLDKINHNQTGLFFCRPVPCSSTSTGIKCKRASSTFRVVHTLSCFTSLRREHGNLLMPGFECTVIGPCNNIVVGHALLSRTWLWFPLLKSPLASWTHRFF